MLAAGMNTAHSLKHLRMQMVPCVLIGSARSNTPTDMLQARQEACFSSIFGIKIYCIALLVENARIFIFQLIYLYVKSIIPSF